MMTASAIIGSTYCAEKKPMRLAWDLAGIAVVFMINLALLYGMR